MNIAITAASGQLGTAVVKATSELVGGDSVIALARTPGKAKGLGVAVRPGSYDDRSARSARLRPPTDISRLAS